MNTMQQDFTKDDQQITGLSVAIKSNNDQVLSQLYQKNYPKVRRYLLDNQGSETEAKDIYQEAFIVVWSNIQLNKFLPETENEFAAYLFQVSKNKWIDVLRIQKRRIIVPASDMEEQQEVNLDISEAENMYTVLIKKNFSKLGQTCRELLTSFYFDKVSLHNIAASRQWTEATAKNNKYRCIQQLRALVKKEKN